MNYRRSHDLTHTLVLNADGLFLARREDFGGAGGLGGVFLLMRDDPATYSLLITLISTTTVTSGTLDIFALEGVVQDPQE